MKKKTPPGSYHCKISHYTLEELFLYCTQHFPERTAFCTVGGNSYTYEQFGNQTRQIAQTLHQYGIAPKDKVAILSRNCANWPVSYFSAVAFGRISVPLLPDFSSTEIETILEHSESRALIVSQKLLHKIPERAKERLSLIIQIEDFSVIKGEKADLPEVHTVPFPDDLASIIYTSGTTGNSKGVMLSHKNLCANLSNALIMRPGYEWDVWFSFLPLSHTLECSLSMMLPMATGSSVHYLDKAPSSPVLLACFQSIRPTTMLSVPLVIEKIYKNLVLPKFTKSFVTRTIYHTTLGRKLLHRLAGVKLQAQFGGRLRFFGIGGAKLDPVVERFLLEARFPYAIGYGLTETSPLLAGANPQMVHLGSTGPCAHGVTLQILHPNPATGEGEIVAKGDNIMMGYYKNPEATSQAFTPDGWFHTKDLGVMDSQKRLYVKGRVGNMIVGPSGENIYPEEIESIINSHDSVDESLVMQRKGLLVAMIHLKSEATLQRMEALKADVRDYVNSKVNKFSKIASIEITIEQFQKTATQKIKRYLYR